MVVVGFALSKFVLVPLAVPTLFASFFAQAVRRTVVYDTIRGVVVVASSSARFGKGESGSPDSIDVVRPLFPLKRWLLDDEIFCMAAEGPTRLPRPLATTSYDLVRLQG